MKKMLAVTIVAAGVFAVGAMAPQQSKAAPSPSINMEEVLNFQQESADLRGEIVVKKLELIGETMKQPVDSARVRTLAHEVIDLQSKIGALANKHGLPGPSAFQQVISSKQMDLSEEELKAISERP